MRISALHALGVTAAVVLAGCGQAQLWVAPGPIQNSVVTTYAERAAFGTGPILYATDYGYSQVTLYHANAKDPSPIGTITDGLTFPNGVCIDGAGTLYVTNEPINGTGWIAEYPFGKSAPSMIITKGVNTPGYCAIDSNGNLWVTNIGTPNATEYLHGSKKPHTVITDGMMFPTGIAIDQSGNLYVANRVSGGSNVVVYARGSKTPSRTITNGITSPVGAAIDASGILYVANIHEQNVEEYRPGADSPFQTITEGLPTPMGVTVNEKGWLYVSNGAGSNHRVIEFAPGSVIASKRHVSKGLHGPTGDAIYPPVLP